MGNTLKNKQVAAIRYVNKHIEVKPVMGNTNRVPDATLGERQSSSKPKQKKNGSTRKGYMRMPQSTEVTGKFEKDLRKKMKTFGIDLESVDDVSKVEEGTPLILICNIVSRVGQDVATSLQSIKGQTIDRVCIVALHMRGNVPIMRTADRLTEMQEYKIIDMAYCPDKRIFHCFMNNEAYRQLKSFISNTSTVEVINPKNGHSDKNKGSTRKAYMWTPQSTKLTGNFEEELRKKMKKKFGIDVKSVDDVYMMEEDTPLILICNVVSRVGQDVATSLQFIKGQKLDRVCIVALHVIGNIPTMRTADRLTEIQEYIIIDMAYCPDKRIFDCSMNNEAYTQLKSFILNKETDEVINSKNGHSDKNKDKKSAVANLLTRCVPCCTAHRKKEGPWRNLEAGVQLNEDYKKTLLDQVKITELDKADMKSLENINILLIGSDQAGKSSFIRSIAYIANEPIDTGEEVERELKIFSWTPFKLYYTTCTNDLMDLQTEDILYMAKGNVLPEYKFNSDSPIDKTHEKFKKDVEFKEMMHCVVYVMNADKVGAHNKRNHPLWKISDIQKIQTGMEPLDIPTIIILTNVEILSRSLAHNNTNIYESRTVGNAVKLATEMFSVQEQNVFPVKNFTEESKLETHMEILLLLALRQMLNFSVDFIKSQNQNENTESGCTFV